MIKFKPDQVAGGIIFSFGIFIFYQSRALGDNAKLIPLIIAALLAIVSTIVIVRSNKSKLPVNFFSISMIRETLSWSMIAVLSLTLIYAKSLILLGFEIASFIYIILLMAIIERKFIWTRMLLSGIVTVSLVLIFSFGLKLRIPLLLFKILNLE